MRSGIDAEHHVVAGSCCHESDQAHFETLYIKKQKKEESVVLYEYPIDE